MSAYRLKGQFENMTRTVYKLGLFGAIAAVACSPADGQNSNTQNIGGGAGFTPGGSTPVAGQAPADPLNPGGTPQGSVPPGPGADTPQPGPTVSTPTAPTPNPTATTPDGTVAPGGEPGSTEETEPCKEGDNLAVVHTNGNWIGCDPALDSDNPGGVQGAFYLYGDGTSCDDTAVPCDETGCHLQGTSIDGDPAEDWGCGLGLGLNTDANEQKQPYTGATCFDVAIAGTTGGLELRIAFTQHDGSGSTVVAPFRNIAPFADGWSGEVCVADVSCPSWSLEDELCETSGDVYDLQIQVAAGEMDTAYDLTLTQLVPKAESSVVANDGMGPTMLTGAGESCENYHSATVGADGQSYVLINNVWNPSGGQQCISYNGTSFTITSQTGNSGSTEPVSFPAVILGRKAEHFASGGGLPAQVSSIQSLETGFKIKAAGVSGTFNAAYDVWIDADQGYSGNAPDYFLMLWPWTQGDVRPAGTVTGNVTIEGVKWDVWTGGVGEGGGKYIAYQSANTESLHVDLKPFLDDAVANRGLPASSYVLNVQAGFEIWNGGSGLASEYFYAKVQ